MLPWLRRTPGIGSKQPALYLSLTAQYLKEQYHYYLLKIETSSAAADFYLTDGIIIKVGKRESRY